MSIFLKRNNWLVADWVIKKFNKDLILVDTGQVYKEINSELLHSAKIYTFLLDYSKVSKDKLLKLNQLVVEIITGYEKGIIQFDGKQESFESYKIKLLELHRLTTEEIEDFNHEV